MIIHLTFFLVLLVSSNVLNIFKVFTATDIFFKMLKNGCSILIQQTYFLWLCIQFQIVGSAGFKICDVNCCWFGRANDCRSEVKDTLEGQHRLICATDMGCVMSYVLIEPYTVDEKLEDPTKAEFITAHSCLRTV